jgi:Ser/Thr protein kinase RdoA (MazF antagonist)
MHPHLLSLACQLYATTPDLLIPLSGGHSNAVYKFPLQKTSQVFNPCEALKFGVLRIGVQDCPAEQTLGMLEWARFLHDHGAPVTAPLPSTNHHLLEHLEFEGAHYIITAFQNSEGTLAENIPPSEWTDHLFCSIGRAAGKFHRISLGYTPSSPTLTRPMWFDSYEIVEASTLLASSRDPAREKLAALVESLKLLPADPSDFGLIHDDLHFANFLIQADGMISIIDFDDCVYSWFAMDVAMALFDILVLYDPASEVDKQAFARRFLSNYLVGYRAEKEMSQSWLEQIPRFLKLKELCIYATLIGHAEIAQPGSWVERFMRDRSARITGDVPYVDIDFAVL